MEDQAGLRVISLEMIFRDYNKSKIKTFANFGLTPFVTDIGLDFVTLSFFPRKSRSLKISVHVFNQKIIIGLYRIPMTLQDNVIK